MSQSVFVSNERGDRRPPQSAILAGIGGVWLSFALGGGPLTFLLAIVPGGLLFGSAIACLAMGDDARSRQLGALGSFLGVFLALPLLFVQGFATGLLLGALAAVAFVAEGWISMKRTPAFEDVPAAAAGVRYAAEIAGDDAILGWMLQSLNTPAYPMRSAHEVEQARVLFADRGWLEKPADYHEAPPRPDDALLAPASFRGIGYGHLRFTSGYAPRLEEPGRDRWLSRAENRTAHAWILRHEGEPRPWLICIHG